MKRIGAASLALVWMSVLGSASAQTPLVGATAEPPLKVGSADFTSQPSLADMAAAYPPEALKAQATGSASLRCSVAERGLLQGCAVAEETPAGSGFAAAALSLVPKYRLALSAQQQAQTTGRPIAFRMKFALQAPPAGASPPAGSEGVATIQCKTTAEGGLTDCAVLSEEPAGLGFGAAALRTAALIHLKPTAEGGALPGTLFKRRIRFKITP